MVKHVKIYLEYFDYCQDDFIPCENCSRKAVDIHHLVFRSQLGKDEISNLMALCRDCHDIAHSSTELNNQLKRIHADYLKRFTEN